MTNKERKRQRRFTEIQVNEDAKREYSSNKKNFCQKDLNPVSPMTANQQKLFDLYHGGYDLALYGSAGTGKTFLSMYLALNQILDKNSVFDKLIIVRSVVPTRDIGFLPGELDEKLAVYEEPYMAICNELFKYKNAYTNLKAGGYVDFVSTSFIRGLTFNNAIILVDECENLNFHEFDSIITRVGEYSKIIFSGDLIQTDLLKNNKDRSGMADFLNIAGEMIEFKFVEFKPQDIVRSGLVKSYIMAREKVKRSY